MFSLCLVRPERSPCASRGSTLEAAQGTGSQDAEPVFAVCCGDSYWPGRRDRSESSCTAGIDADAPRDLLYNFTLVCEECETQPESKQGQTSGSFHTKAPAMAGAFSWLASR